MGAAGRHTGVVALGAGIVVVLGAAAWMLLGDDGDAPLDAALHVDTPDEVIVGAPVEPAAAPRDATETPLAPEVAEPEVLPTTVRAEDVAISIDDLPRREVRVVLEDGTPVEGALVMLTDVEHDDLDVLGTTDADGLARVEPLTFGRLEAHHAELGASRRWHLEAFEFDDPLTLTLRPVVIVGGLVQDELGQPAPNALVSSDPGASTLQHVVPAPERATADAEGRFELHVSGWWDGAIRAARDGFESEPVTVVRGQRHVLHLPARYAIVGDVVDARGDPIDEPLVTVWPDQADVARGAMRAFRQRAYGLPDGSFEVFVDEPGDYVLVARTGSAPPSDVTRARVGEWSPRASTRLIVPDAAAITGRVVDGRGDPIETAIVRARPAHLYEPELEAFTPTPFTRLGKADTTTDADGRFTLPDLRADAEYIVFCRPEPNVPDRKVVLKGIRGDTSDLTIVASEENLRRATWTGVVFSEATGLAVETPRVSLAIRLDGRELSAELTPELPQDGSFAFTGLAPTYEFQLRVDGVGCGAWQSEWWTAAVPGRHDVIHLPPPARLEVETQRPHVTVEITRLDPVIGVDPTITRRADAGGRAVFNDVAAGRYVITQPTDGETVTLTHGETTRVDL